MIPYDVEAEEMVVGGMIAAPTRLTEAMDMLDPEDFHDQRCAKVFAALVSLHQSGHVVNVHAAAVESGVDTNTVLDLMTNAPGAPTRHTVERILRLATARRLMGIGASLASDAADGKDPYELAEQVTLDLGTLDAPRRGVPTAVSMETICNTSEELSPWVIPGMLRSDWRAIIVAGEGAGKSTLLRQIAMTSSQGLHPLNFRKIMPIRVLLVDLENPVQAIAETGKRIHNLICNTNGGYDDEALVVYMKPGGIDIRTRRDRVDLEREIVAHRPDLVIMGPVYKLSQRHSGESYEDATDPVLRVLDDLRTRHRFALMLEHHAPQANQGARELRPFGSQRWLAWPELGYGLKADNQTGALTVRPFRGDRLVNDWPAELVRGKTWPWVGQWEEPI